jgi:hypothetical protein
MAKARLDPNSESFHMHMIVTQAWVARVSAYAKRHGINRSQAIRLLIDEALVSPQ